MLLLVQKSGLLSSVPRRILRKPRVYKQAKKPYIFKSVTKMINLKRILFEDKLEATQMNAQILFCSFAVMGLLLFIVLVYLIKKYIQMGKNEKEEQLRKILKFQKIVLLAKYIFSTLNLA